MIRYLVGCVPRTRWLAAVVALAVLANWVLVADHQPDRGYRMTPYAGLRDTGFVRGASLDVSAIADAGQLPGLLSAMKERHHIDTVAVYGLEHWDSGADLGASGREPRKDLLFTELARLGMRVVIRIEGYDPAGFAFRACDLEQVLTWYEPLIRYVSAPARRDLVAYFALNMPVDDPGVQRRLGGINSALSQQRQPEYAAAFVARMRALLARYGLPGAGLYLGVFYGWDNSYQTPSYAAAGADGYFLTNYSYPAGAVADETADEATLINQPRLRIAMDRFVSQYGDAPVVVEYGFQTLEYHRGVLAGQQAGLVANAAAKRRALAATTRFYRAGYPGVRGTVYFGYNVFKAEGDPPAVLDFALDYPGGAPGSR